MNKVIIAGFLGKNPEIKQTTSGKSVCNFSIATKFKDQTTWHKIIVWGKTADNCALYLSKGSQALVEGSLTTRKWEKDGNIQYTTEILAQNVTFLDSKQKQDDTPF